MSKAGLGPEGCAEPRVWRGSPSGGVTGFDDLGCGLDGRAAMGRPRHRRVPRG